VRVALKPVRSDCSPSGPVPPPAKGKRNDQRDGRRKRDHARVRSHQAVMQGGALTALRLVQAIADAPLGD
jgi:hypothetical protein